LTRAPALLVLLALLFLGPAARANPSRVVVIRPPATDQVTAEAIHRVAGELVAAGFEVAFLDASPERDARAQLAAAAERLDPVATFAIFPLREGGAAEVWLTDRTSGKTVIQRIETRSISPSHVSAVLAVRAVEVLRASFLDLRPKRESETPAEQSSPPQRDVPPSSGTSPLTRNGVGKTPSERSSLQSLAASVGVAFLHGFQGIGAGVLPVAKFSYGMGAWAGRLSFAGLGPSVRVDGAVGSALIHQELVSAELLAVFVNHRFFAMFGSMGGGIYHFRLAGEGATPYYGKEGDLTTPVFTAGVGAEARLGPHFSMILDVTALFPRTTAVIRFMDAEVASAGRPSLLAAVGVVAFL
jgi:hypothetical protein